MFEALRRPGGVLRGRCVCVREADSNISIHHSTYLSLMAHPFLSAAQQKYDCVCVCVLVSPLTQWDISSPLPSSLHVPPSSLLSLSVFSCFLTRFLSGTQHTSFSPPYPFLWSCVSFVMNEHSSIHLKKKILPVCLIWGLSSKSGSDPKLLSLGPHQ